MSRETDIDATIARLDSPERLEQFAINVEPHSPEHAKAARRRAVELRAARHGVKSAVERECLEAIYAYERAESKIRGRKFRASRTWPMLERRGIIPAVEFIVTRRVETTGYRTLIEMGLQDMAFEAVVLRHPEAFSAEAARASRARLERWGVRESDQ
jgi:hypothetical protein